MHDRDNAHQEGSQHAGVDVGYSHFETAYADYVAHIQIAEPGVPSGSGGPWHGQVHDLVNYVGGATGVRLDYDTEVPTNLNIVEPSNQ